MLKRALRSAQMPKVHEVSMQTPVYIFPLADSIAAATPPAEIRAEISRGFCTACAALYRSIHICSIYIILGALSASIALALPYLISRFIDLLVEPGAEPPFALFIQLMAFLSLSDLAIGYLSNEIYYKVQLRVSQNMAEDLILHLQDFDLNSEILTNSSELNYQVNNDSNMISSRIRSRSISIPSDFCAGI